MTVLKNSREMRRELRNSPAIGWSDLQTEEQKAAAKARYLKNSAERFFVKIAEGLASAHQELSTFAANLSAPDGDPTYYLSWSGDAFQAAARIKVYSTIIADTAAVRSAKDADLVAIRQAVVSEATRKVVSSCRTNVSSSPTSNLMDTHITAAWARIVEESFIW